MLEYPSLKPVYVRIETVRLQMAYIPGFLAFREAPFLQTLFDKLLSEHPELWPDVLLVDGNGVLHYRGFGLASHLAVLVDVPAVGIGKKLLCVDGLTRDVRACACVCDCMPLL